MAIHRRIKITVTESIAGYMDKQILVLSYRQWLLFWRQQWLVIRQYRHHRRFLLSWIWLHFSYLFSSPYRLSKRYQRRIRSEALYVYGDTPLTTLEYIAKRADVSPADHVYELGAGSGFTSLWLHEVKGCSVTAIEQVPVFCWRLQRTARRFHLNRISVRCDDYMTTEIKSASVIYLYGSNLDDDTVFKLTLRLAAMPSGTRIITVSYPLDPEDVLGVFQPQDCFEAEFEWGTADVYIQNIR